MLEAAVLMGFAGTAVRVVIVLIVTAVLVKLGDSVVNRVLVRPQKPGDTRFDEARRKTLASLLKSSVRYVATAAALLTILQLVGIDIKALLGGVAIVGLAVGFGAQSLVKDIITGFFIIYERQYDVGDYITAAGLSGIVEEVGLRTTRLKDWSGDVHIIPNGLIDKTTNSSDANSRALIEIPLAHEEDARKAIAVMQEVCDQVAKDFPAIVEGPRVLGIGRMDAAGVGITVWARTKPLEHWPVERELRLRIKEALDREGIKRPYPLLRMHAEK